MNKQKGFDMELFFAALADRTRLRLLNLIGNDEICVCFFVEVLQANQPKISRHLAYLRKAGLVRARREGKWMHYRITEPADERAVRVFSDVRAWLEEEPEMRRDRAIIKSMLRAAIAHSTARRATPDKSLDIDSPSPAHSRHRVWRPLQGNEMQRCAPLVFKDIELSKTGVI